MAELTHDRSRNVSSGYIGIPRARDCLWRPAVGTHHSLFRGVHSGSIPRGSPIPDY